MLPVYSDTISVQRLYILFYNNRLELRFSQTDPQWTLWTWEEWLRTLFYKNKIQYL